MKDISIYQTVGISSLFTIFIITVFIFLSKTIINNFFINAIKHDYDVKLERVKNEIIQNNTDIKNLRDGALSGVNYRQSIIYDKKVETAEKLWNNIVDLSKAKFYPQILSKFNIKEVSLKATEDEKMQNYFISLEGKWRRYNLCFKNSWTRKCKNYIRKIFRIYTNSKFKFWKLF